ncbi:MAG: helical backbone metal receptor, partial [Betaproteobacteria bacterium]|nr:helical backbone metal receptor [Betaproteobacteria bacterium]
MTPSSRIVSLVPSLTELVCALGLGEALVGRTGFCVHPQDVVRRIPKVGGTKDVDLAKVRALEPTHVVLNVDENRKETADELATFVPNLVVTHPLGPLDNLGLYR